MRSQLWTAALQINVTILLCLPCIGRPLAGHTTSSSRNDSAASRLSVIECQQPQAPGQAAKQTMASQQNIIHALGLLLALRHLLRLRRRRGRRLRRRNALRLRGLLLRQPRVLLLLPLPGLFGLRSLFLGRDSGICGVGALNKVADSADLVLLGRASEPCVLALNPAALLPALAPLCAQL